MDHESENLWREIEAYEMKDCCRVAKTCTVLKVVQIGLMDIAGKQQILEQQSFMSINYCPVCGRKIER